MFRKFAEDFDKLDTDKDGKLTAEEATFPDQDAWKWLLKEFDEDQDGALSLPECESMQKKLKKRFEGKRPPGPGYPEPGPDERERMPEKENKGNDG